MPRKKYTKNYSKGGNIDPSYGQPAAPNPDSVQFKAEERIGTNNDKDFFEKIKLTILMYSTMIAEFAKRQSQLKSISEYIEFNPMQTITKNVNGNLVQEIVPIGVLKIGSITYYFLYTILFMVFTALPLIITIISIIYIITSLNLNYWFKSRRFNGDDLRYVDADNIKSVQLFNIKFFYINDYILYISIICIIYIFSLIYVNFSVFVRRDLSQYKEYMIKIQFLLALIIGVILIHLYIYHGYVQKIGKLKEALINTAYNHINYDYIDFLSDVVVEDKQCEAACKVTINDTTVNVCSCSKPICDVNSMNTLTQYISEQLAQLKLKAGGSDIKLISIERFKTFKNDDGEVYYDLIRNAILTYAFISNFVTTEFCKLSSATIDRKFFQNRTSLIGSINIKSSSLYELNPLKCINRNIDNMNNKSEFMLKICQECNEVMRMSNSIILNLKSEMSNFSLPLQIFTVLTIMIICIIYYLSFTINIIRKQSYNMNPMGMGMGMHGMPGMGMHGMPGMYGY